MAEYVAPQPTVNPFVGWKEAPVTVPDTSKVVPNRNYTYPKVHHQEAPTFIATKEIANETIYPEVPVPLEGSPSYNLYNKTESFVEHVHPVAQSTTSGSQVGVYDSSTPQEALPVHTGTLEPTASPVVVMNANELPVVPLEEVDVLEIKETPDWVVQIPSESQPMENNGVENIKISFIEKKKPVLGVNEVSLQPPIEGNTESIKISFIENKTSPDGSLIPLAPSGAQEGHESIRISFEKEKEENVAPTGVPLVVTETEGPIVVHNAPTITNAIVTAHAQPTEAPAMPSGPGVVNPFEGGVVDHIIGNATLAPVPPPHQNITVDFLHNATIAARVVQQPHVTVQQQRK